MDVRKIMEEEAKRKGVSFEEYYEAVKIVLLEGYYNGNEEEKAVWASLGFADHEPTPEEAIEVFVRVMDERKRTMS